MRLAGARPGTRLEGLDLLPGKAFYYIGNDPGKWRTGVPQNGRVAYRDVYPGVDLIFYGSAGQLEYDLILEPHAILGRVRLRFDGARRLAVEANGDLRIESSQGVLRQKRPLVYQEIGGRRRQLAASYIVAGRDVRFAVNEYDPARRLLIDPVVVYATYFGGSADETPWAMAVDAAGDVYVTGYTDSSNYPTSPQTPANGPHGGDDVFVTKIDPTGQKLLYSVILGGNQTDHGYAIAVDSSGNAYVAGGTTSINFPTLNPSQNLNKGGWDAFVLKLDPAGNLLYSTYLGGGQRQPCGCEAWDFAYGIALDPAGTAWVTGTTWSADFPTTVNAVAPSYVPDWGDAFVSGFSSAGKLVFSTVIGGTGTDRGAAITVGSSGMLYVTGTTLSASLPVTAGAVQKGNAGYGSSQIGDGWAAKLNPRAASSTGVIVALTYLGGSSDDNVYAIAVDNAENVYLAGSTLSTDFPVTKGAYQTAFSGGSSMGDAFVSKLNSTFTSIIYSSYFGGPGDEFATGLQLDSAGDVYFAGTTTSWGLSPASLGSNPTAIQPTFNGGTNGYLAELNPTGSSILYFTFLGQGNVSFGWAMGMDAAGSLYNAFGTQSQGMPVVTPALQNTLAGGQDLFLMKIGMPALPANPVVIGSVNTAGGGTDIAQNTWIEIHGKGLAPASVAATGDTWNNAPEFASGMMPTALDGVGVNVNGKPAYIDYVSATQVNALTPLDSTTGPVQVTLNNGSHTSAAFTVNLKTVVPAFLQFGSGPYIAALHGDNSLLGPASMSVPGYTFTPAQPGETIVLYGVGFGMPASALTAGSSTQLGALPSLPVITIGGSQATVLYAGVAEPGLYQFNVTVPGSAANGDNAVIATYAGASTPSGAMISVSR